MEEYAFITHKHIVHHRFALMKQINFINTHLYKLYSVDPIFENVLFQCEKITFRRSNLFFSFGNEIFKQCIAHYHFMNYNQLILFNETYKIFGHAYIGSTNYKP
jgi:hypothetical protein